MIRDLIEPEHRLSSRTIVRYGILGDFEYAKDLT